MPSIESSHVSPCSSDLFSLRLCKGLDVYLVAGGSGLARSSRQEGFELDNIFHSKSNNAIGSTCLSKYPILRNLSLYSPK